MPAITPSAFRTLHRRVLRSSRMRFDLYSSKIRSLAQTFGMRILKFARVLKRVLHFNKAGVVARKFGSHSGSFSDSIYMSKSQLGSGTQSVWAGEDKNNWWGAT